MIFVPLTRERSKRISRPSAASDISPEGYRSFSLSLAREGTNIAAAHFLAKCAAMRQPFKVSPILPLAVSTDLTVTSTTSPTLSTSDGCLIKRSEISEMWTSPS